MMYGKQGIEINLTDDGSYMVKVVIENPEKKKNEKAGTYIEEPMLEKTLAAKNVGEVKALVDKYLPGLTKLEAKEDEFDKAFNASASKKG